MSESWKAEIVKKALEQGLIRDTHWLDMVDEPMPVWEVLRLVLALVERFDPPSDTYD